MRSVFASCVCRDDSIYGFDDVNLACLDLRTGKRTWKENGFGKGSLDFVLRAWTDREYEHRTSEMALAIHRRLRDAGIALA